MATPRNFLRMPDIPRRRRSARQALAMIPGSDGIIKSLFLLAPVH